MFRYVHIFTYVLLCFNQIDACLLDWYDLGSVQSVNEYQWTWIGTLKMRLDMPRKRITPIDRSIDLIWVAIWLIDRFGIQSHWVTLDAWRTAVQIFIRVFLSARNMYSYFHFHYRRHFHFASIVNRLYVLFVRVPTSFKSDWLIYAILSRRGDTGRHHDRARAGRAALRSAPRP